MPNHQLGDVKERKSNLFTFTINSQSVFGFKIFYSKVKLNSKNLIFKNVEKSWIVYSSDHQQMGRGHSFWATKP